MMEIVLICSAIIAAIVFISKKLLRKRSWLTSYFNSEGNRHHDSDSSIGTSASEISATPTRETKLPFAKSIKNKTGLSDEIDLIDMMNNLQSKLLASGEILDVPLPQIVVVGGQSSGKSSILENIVGREFLPRGKGLVTRRPTLIQLHPNPGEEYVIFNHKPDQKFKNFADVKQEILDQMPDDNAFSSVPIELKIFSPRVLKLTLIDLPGLVHVAVDNQSASSVAEVRNMVLNYIQPPETLILAVTPANQDLASSDALAIAAEVDPNRVRTIGVVTKLDLMDEGTDARDILENRKLTLKMGYIGVRNRSEMDIQARRDINYILEKEKEFFREKECYRHLRNKMGTPYLVRSLQKILRTHIKNALPTTRKKLALELSKYETKLCEFERNMGESGNNGKQFYMIKLVNTFIEDITLQLMGNSELMDMTVISSGAFINYKLNTEVQQNLKLEIAMNQERMTTLINNIHGIRGAISFPSLSLDAMCRSLVSEYKYPMEKSIECIKSVLVEAVENSANLLNSYLHTKNEVLYKIGRCVDHETVKVKTKLREHVEAEMFHVNLEHPDMDLSDLDPAVPAVGPCKVWDSSSPESTTETVSSTTETVSSGTSATDERSAKNAKLLPILMANASVQKKVEYLTLVMTKYMKIVQKQICDITVKYILCFLVKKVLDFIRFDLIATLLETGNFNSLTEDCEEDFRLKTEMENACTCLREALDAIQAF